MEYDKLWFVKSKNNVSSLVLSFHRFQGPKIQFKALNRREQLKIFGVIES